MQLAKVFIWGMVISFLGSLPLGPLNLITTYISVSDGANAAILFSAGCIVSELIFVRLALTAMNWLSQRQRFFKTLEWITIIIILLLVVFSFKAAIQKTEFTSAMPTNINHPFWSGILFSAVDPMKIPFWFLWSTFLMGNKTLLPKSNNYNFYVTGIGLGSLLGFMVFIYGGIYLIGSIKTHQDIINWSIGGILLLTAIIQVYRLRNRKEEKLEESSKAKIVEMSIDNGTTLNSA
jgi:threonine/homoserine/homoserine lactone efflux protein